MVPSPPPIEGQLNCKLTLEFNGISTRLDAKDVRVRFYSPALRHPAEFDWSFMAESHSFPHSSQPLRDHASRASSPPLGRAIRVQFPLAMQKDLPYETRPIWLQAELYWGGEIQDSARLALDSIYRSVDATGPETRPISNASNAEHPRARLLGSNSEDPP